MASSLQNEAPPLTHRENEEFLRMIRDARKRLGCEAPEVEIVFDRVSVEAVVPVGRRTMPTLPNAIINGGKTIVDSVFMCRSREKTFKIIDAVSGGTIRSSRMTLVLGAPGSGKTTLLKTLAGKLDSSLTFHGNVMYKYNGKTRSSTSQHLCAYVSQNDLHHPEMTVRETINFASNMLGANNEFEMLRDALQRKMETCNELNQDLFAKATKLGKGSNLKTNYIIKILGLSDCADTIVGDELHRGISGGQKKRTTIGK